MKFRISFTLEPFFLRTGRVGYSTDLSPTFGILGKHLAAAAFLPWEFYGISQQSLLLEQEGKNTYGKFKNSVSTKQQNRSIDIPPIGSLKYFSEGALKNLPNKPY